MNEDELKEIWNDGGASPAIDFPRLQNLSDNADKKLRRNAKYDVLTQGSVLVLTCTSIYFYPKLVIALILLLSLGVWYIRELRKLSLGAGLHISSSSVRERIKERIAQMNSYFWRTRIACTVFIPLISFATLYGMGMYDSWQKFIDRSGEFAKFIIIAEIGVIVINEIYFRILYTPALKQLENILSEFD